MSAAYMNTGSTSHSHLQSLDTLRGLSAIAVYVSHVTQQFLEPDAMGWIGAALELLGVVGVSVFFVLSGFLIHMGGIRERQRAGRQNWNQYARRRFLRIVPAYVVALVVYALAGSQVKSHMITEASWLSFLSHLLFFSSFVPNEYQSINAIFWTVVVELHFYAMYPLLLRVTRGWEPWAVFSGTWALGIAFFFAASAFTKPGDIRVMWQHTAPALFWKWALGILLAEIAFRDYAPKLRAFLSKSGLLLPILVGVWAGTFIWEQTALALNYKRFISPFFCAALVGLFLFSSLRNWRSALGEWLGGLSYSIYLWHPLALAVTAKLSLSTFGEQLAVSLALTLLASQLSFSLVEQPCMNRARGTKIQPPPITSRLS